MSHVIYIPDNSPALEDNDENQRPTFNQQTKLLQMFIEKFRIANLDSPANIELTDPITTSRHCLLLMATDVNSSYSIFLTGKYMTKLSKLHISVIEKKDEEFNLKLNAFCIPVIQPAIANCIMTQTISQNNPHDQFISMINRDKVGISITQTEQGIRLKMYLSYIKWVKEENYLKDYLVPNYFIKTYYVIFDVRISDIFKYGDAYFDAWQVVNCSNPLVLIQCVVNIGTFIRFKLQYRNINTTDKPPQSLYFEMDILQNFAYINPALLYSVWYIEPDMENKCLILKCPDKVNLSMGYTELAFKTEYIHPYVVALFIPKHKKNMKITARWWFPRTIFSISMFSLEPKRLKPGTILGYIYFIHSSLISYRKAKPGTTIDFSDPEYYKNIDFENPPKEFSDDVICHVTSLTPPRVHILGADINLTENPFIKIMRNPHAGIQTHDVLGLELE
ncbi:hypothetical protein MRV_0074 [Murid herpesvirus 3]|uniref:Uncharacterized protein n=2 Tax=Murid betaherpesvirus 3 TaxID=2560603 RepID=A0A1P8VIX1_9BETA|nr:hypothetical protein MRV_0074 [Murine roseolovirus]APZ76285.1 hypothetical protein MRV_0074 [Murid betaherpesvirus 3]AYH64737.1 hypothetical protein MRV_0074 [Murid herpesvirus 3]